MTHKREQPASLVIPGYRGSGPQHWQSWLEARLPCSRRLQGVDWHQPVLASWAARVRDELQRSPGPLWLIAHDFGCLAVLAAAADVPARVAGLLLVAPTHPAHFDFLGLRDQDSHKGPSLDAALPNAALDLPGLLIASRNDRWLDFEQGRVLAHGWGLPLHDAGDAGHLDADAGYGPWPDLLDQVQDLMRYHQPARDPLPAALARGRGSVLASIRQYTRQQLERS